MAAVNAFASGIVSSQRIRFRRLALGELPRRLTCKKRTVCHRPEAIAGLRPAAPPAVSVGICAKSPRVMIIPRLLNDLICSTNTSESICASLLGNERSLAADAPGDPHPLEQAECR